MSYPTQLPRLQAPAYTARLEVDYKQKVPAGSTILCTTELESIGEGEVTCPVL